MNGITIGDMIFKSHNIWQNSEKNTVSSSLKLYNGCIPGNSVYILKP